jgi:serpin B
MLYDGRGAGYEAVDLPYLYSTLSMLVVMPSRGTLGRFEQGLGVGSLTRVAASLRPRQVALRMPRFHIVEHAELNQVLSALGMPLAFSDQADFSGITAQIPLKIATVQHSADLKVDEYGTVAAAATGVALMPTAVAPSPVTRLTLDHPFLLFLRDDATGAVLFAGRLADPTAS